LDDPKLSPATQTVLRYVLETVVTLLHPFMPFITETIWQDGLGKQDLLATTTWPELHQDLLQPDDAAAFAQLKETVETIRRLRSERHTPPGTFISALLITPDPAALEAAAPVLKNLARIESLSIGETLDVPKDAVTTVVGNVTIALPLEGLVDAAAETERLQKELEAATMKVERLTERLANKDYVSKAPKQLVEQTQADLEEAERAVEELSRHAGQ
jgi:valyl-tRNA synthetase